jgi:hypothetical protein
LETEARAVEAAVYAALDAGILTTDVAPKSATTASTEAFAGAVAETLNTREASHV